MKKIIQTNKAPSAIGAYSQAVKAGDTVYISGQIALNPDTSEVESDRFLDQASQVFDNLSAIAEASGGSLSDIVKLTVFLIDLNDFSALNELMAERIPNPYPARAVVEVSALPKGVMVEMDAVLVVKE